MKKDREKQRSAEAALLARLMRNIYRELVRSALNPVEGVKGRRG